ncbi:DNA-binding response regulator, OmpR family, contains REC and winged-helix (wHTH) domain [Microbacterium sp. ru370.1]|uniref:response regulator transcription factor n=1 Tax=unclassified Microbacterium TaxID=2609290 RepID=UPI00088E5B65|nr:MULTISPECIES: response regulator transcription factor [unclassified Microbacterium]SDO77091.1 DNA-binding response regulator, OmpR family, contains REC and winged-helix (wHTH) domain [Microbacterium sp. ru370.1]SIT88752.1 DNA-binding response regulator, OmpR family, contains REC and winged-helix (wHTH) domain [Microbacterium sp. RU1D]
MSASARVLVVDDDETIRVSVQTALRAEGFVTEAAADGSDLSSRLERFRPDLVILDWMMPGPSGIRLLPLVRATGDIPVIMLTARDEVDDRLRGFAEGADDYVVKPFTMAELVARAGVVLRRRGRLPQMIAIGDLLVDPDAATAHRAGASLELTATEFRLLQLFAESRGRTLSKAQILTQVWGYEDYDPNLVEVHLSALRRKMEQHGPRLIHTVRGLGYRLSAAA